MPTRHCSEGPLRRISVRRMGPHIPSKFVQIIIVSEFSLTPKPIVNTLHKGLSIPVTAKFRVFSDVKKTVEYALMMERAGAQILTCHGRTKDQRGHKAVSARASAKNRELNLSRRVLRTGLRLRLLKMQSQYPCSPTEMCFTQTILTNV